MEKQIKIKGKYGIKVIAAFIAMIILLMSVTTSVSAADTNSYENSSGYVENYYKIALEGLDISYDENTEKILVDVSEDLSINEKLEAEKSAEELEFMLDRYDENLDELLIDSLEKTDSSDEELIGISYTECPLEENEYGQLDRIEESENITGDKGFFNKASAVSKTGSASKKYYFSLVTSVTRNNTQNANGKYKYKCKSTATWSENSFVGNSKYPDSGDDYILQTVPNSFAIKSDNLDLQYNYDGVAENGEHYSMVDMGNHYIEYSLVDDPLGINQMEKCVLTTTCRAKDNSKDRMIRSYYVHTWKEMNLDVSVSVNSSAEVELTLEPSLPEKQWQVASYVSFDF